MMTIFFLIGEGDDSVLVMAVFYLTGVSGDTAFFWLVWVMTLLYLTGVDDDSVL